MYIGKGLLYLTPLPLKMVGAFFIYGKARSFDLRICENQYEKGAQSCLNFRKYSKALHLRKD